MIRPVRTEAPADQPLSLAEVKLHLRVDHDEEDSLIASLIAASVELLDGWSGLLGRCLVQQDWRIAFPCFGRVLRLPFPDVSAAAVSYFDRDDAVQAVSADDFSLKEDQRGAYVWFDALWQSPITFARPDAVQITFTAGYGDAAAVPAPIKQALKLLISHFYQNREAAGLKALHEAPMAVQALLAPHRRQRI